MRLRRASIMNAGLLPPTDVTPTVSGDDIVVSWTAANFVDSYNVYTSIDSGTWTLLGNSATTSYSFTPTEPGEYNFRVTSVRGTQESDPSAETLYDEMMEQVYSDTITGLRISAVDGTAFVDAASDITTYADGNHLLEIEDSLGNIASGVLSEQGSGETLGSELVTNGDFSNVTGSTPDSWNTTRASIETETGAGNFQTSPSAKITISAGEISGSIWQTISLSAGGLYKGNTYLKNVSGTELSFKLQDAKAPSYANLFRLAGLNPATITQYTQYGTQFLNSTDAWFYPGLIEGAGGSCFYTDDCSAKQVTAPSTSGAIIVSEIDGATQNFFDIETGFEYNEASYIVRVKKILPTA